DGRDANDVVLGLFDYREGFNVSLHVNFVDGGDEGEGFTFSGDEGTMSIGWDGLTVNQVPRQTAPGYMVGTFPEAMQKEIITAYDQKYPPGQAKQSLAATEKFSPPKGYSDSYDHFKNFFASVRSRQPVVEDAVFGYRAAGAALLTNLSIDRGQVVRWDPEAMKLLS
ncbi:MAG TPA: gfo/Idh/MocA family oxidoreductase, partial [Terracidiphilus sp.]